MTPSHRAHSKTAHMFCALTAAVLASQSAAAQDDAQASLADETATDVAETADATAGAALPMNPLPGEARSPVGLLRSPGMPRIYWGQTTRFTSAFNPALGVAVDGSFNWADDGEEEDGYAFDLGVAELTGQGAISPYWWGNFALETDAEEVELTEAALFYTGLADRTSIRAGRFFLDFGKQMQIHVHDLATPQRPAVLREFLGTEVPGTGFQFDHWSPVGDATAFRFSVGVFGEQETHGHGFLFDEEDHDHGGGGHTEAESFVDDRRDFTDLIFSARATAMTDVGDESMLQFGASMRTIPDFGFEGGEDDTGEELSTGGLDQSVYGLDLTYGWNSDDGTKAWTFGAEYLYAEGALNAEVIDDGLATANLEILDTTAKGWFAYAEHAWNQQNTVGLMVSSLEKLEDELPRETETTLYWSHYPTEFMRVRVAGMHFDREEGEDAQALMLQLTGYIGAHGHPYNW
ncbi:MAG: hypothetical protein PVJ89_07785 [Planctomycetota bacterium]